MAFLADDEMAAFEAALSFVDEFADGRAAPVPTQPSEVLSKQEMEWALSFPSSSKDSPAPRRRRRHHNPTARITIPQLMRTGHLVVWSMRSPSALERRDARRLRSCYARVG
ncbi:hypothetical protein PC111_g24660 [Phytophthora cactorum]|uniref:Uncharacterized protein n=3 Tax=Phytophthora cactorum TaxID=29920 RepID=A0A8T1ABU8_9STRA|nr:hypothetical protein PC111_g24660 [Phytophthora cactorum]KAG2865269.1 hypothetical protein PC114_g28026 [Phytophthora cactorum]KAG2874378.1 hypothetical protein PC117_g27614 [Phytophthora cactorum]KAG4036569.1 hypothetical protein PC123_g27863 [Phytophthora cactorum]